MNISRRKAGLKPAAAAAAVRALKMNGGVALPVREVRLSAGAGFVVVICGEIMTMPGLPRAPTAETIRLDEAGRIKGLFRAARIAPRGRSR